MMTINELSWGRIVAWSQWDRIVLIMAVTCGMPFLFHAIPWLAGPELGARWLPMYYAPLLASICFRPHVFLIVGIGAPLINHALFGMPDSRMMPVLIFELLVFNALVALVSRHQIIRAWQVVLIFMVVRVVSIMVMSGSGAPFGEQFGRSLMMAWPGMLALALLTELLGQKLAKGSR